MKGKLIVIEGSDASGKETQSKLLLKKLKKKGIKFAYFDFPDYNSKTGKKISSYLRGECGDIDEVSPYFASLLYSDDRLAARDKIIRMLKKGRIVVVNRYILSNKAHQSVKIQDSSENEDFFRWIDNTEYKKNRLPKEDILIYLYVPVDTILKWKEKKKKKAYLKGKEDIHESNIKYLKNVEKQYLELAKKHKECIKICCVEDGKELSIEEVHRKIWGIIVKKLNN